MSHGQGAVVPGGIAVRPHDGAISRALLGRILQRISRPLLAPGGPGAVALVAVACAVIGWLRLTPDARDTLWAEDGRLFLHTAASGPQAATLFQPYAGYLHLVPRLEAILTVDAVPVQWWALSMTAMSCAAAGVVAAVVFAASRDLVTWLPARLALAELTVLTPLTSREVLGNAANLHSLLFWGLFWVLLSTPRSRWGTAAYASYALMAALTEVQSVFLLPLLLWRRRDRRTWPVKAAVVIGALAQIAAALLSPRGSTGNPAVGIPSLAEGWFINAVATSWVPIPHLGATLVAVGPAIALLTLIPAAAVAITTALGTRRQRVLAWLLVAGSVLVWCAGVALNPAPWYRYATMSAQQLHDVWLSRYGVVPATMLLAELALAGAVLWARWRGHLVRPAAFAFVMLVAAAAVMQVGEDISRRGSGPTWIPQVPTAVQACERSGPGVASADFAETLKWTVVVPCTYLDPDHSTVAAPGVGGSPW